MLSVAEEASAILKVRIAKGHWQGTIAKLDASGGITQKTLMEMVFMMARKLEEMEEPPMTYDYTVQVADTGPEFPPVGIHPTFSCANCGKDFKTAFGLMGHSKTHLPKKAK